MHRPSRKKAENALSRSNKHMIEHINTFLLLKRCVPVSELSVFPLEDFAHFAVLKDLTPLAALHALLPVALLSGGLIYHLQDECPHLERAK